MGLRKHLLNIDWSVDILWNPDKFKMNCRIELGICRIFLPILNISNGATRFLRNFWGQYYYLYTIWWIIVWSNSFCTD